MMHFQYTNTFKQEFQVENVKSLLLNFNVRQRDNISVRHIYREKFIEQDARRRKSAHLDNLCQQELRLKIEHR